MKPNEVLKACHATINTYWAYYLYKHFRKKNGLDLLGKPSNVVLACIMRKWIAAENELYTQREL